MRTSSLTCCFRYVGVKWSLCIKALDDGWTWSCLNCDKVWTVCINDGKHLHAVTVASHSFWRTWKSFSWKRARFNIVDGSVEETVLEVETIGANQFAKFVKERLTSCEKVITEPISKNKLALFSNPSVKSHPTIQKIQLRPLFVDY